MCLTVDTVVAGNRERDHRTGFSTPPKLTLGSLLSFALHPAWTLNNLFHEKFKLANIIHMTEKGSNIDKSVIDYINEQFDPSMNWKDAEYCVKKWNGPFALKGVMSVEDAKRAIDIGCTAIIISNHGGRQLDGSRAPFDQLAEIVDAVGDKIEVILDGGVRRGTHVLKALTLGIKQAKPGNYVSDIGHAIQSFVEPKGFSIVRELVGHGIGTQLHEDPQVPNYGLPGMGDELKEGMCLAIEPMINCGRKEVYTAEDGWTIKTKDGHNSAHFEHTIAIRENGAEILSRSQLNG